MLRIADRVVGAEICSEFLSEPRVIVHPPGVEVGIAQQELGLEPIERHALEVGLGVDDLCAVIVKGPRAVLKVQLALHEERMEFLGVRTVKLVRFVDLCPMLGFGGLAGGGGGTSKGGDCSHKLQQDCLSGRPDNHHRCHHHQEYHLENHQGSCQGSQEGWQWALGYARDGMGGC